MRFSSEPFCKMGLIGFIYQETFQIQNEEEAAAEVRVTDQTTPGIDPSKTLLWIISVRNLCSLKCERPSQ